MYTENVSKNYQGGLAELRIENKIVPIYSTSKDHCHVQILDAYIKKLPNEVKERKKIYARPLTKLPLNPDEPWFAAVPLGKNGLSTMLKDMCIEADIKGHKTNHSLRATGASELFEAGVPEKIIKERTGHRSLDALRCYEKTTCTQHNAVSSILCQNKTATFSQALEEQNSTTSVQTWPSKYLPTQPVFNNCTFNFGTVPLPPLTSHISATTQPTSAASSTSPHLIASQATIPSTSSAVSSSSNSSLEYMSLFYDVDIMAFFSDD